MTATIEVEPCAWLVPTAPGWRRVRPCMKPTTTAVTDGRIMCAVCPRHLGAAVEHGWREVVA